nr:MAG TPA: nuclease [Caudoviricetes sp.]
MFDEQDRQYFYNEFKSNGYEVGSYDDFKKDLNNKEDRDWYYNEAKNMGYDVGTQADFDKMVLEPAASASPSTGGKQVVASAHASKPQVAQPVAKPKTEYPQEVLDAYNSPDNKPGNFKDLAQLNDEYQRGELKKPSLISQVLGMMPKVDAGNIGREQKMGGMIANMLLGDNMQQPQDNNQQVQQPAQQEASPESKEEVPVTAPTSVVNNEGLLDAKLANYLENWKQRPDKQGTYFENMVADLLADGTANSNEEAVKIVQSALGRYANRSAMDVTNQVVASLPDDTVQDAEKSIEAQWYSHGVQDKLKQEADSMGISYDDYVAQFLKPAMVQSLVNKYGPNYRDIAEGIATRLYSHDEHVQDRLMNQDINEALSDVISKYVSPSVVDEYNKAQEAGSKAFTEGMEGSQFIPANLRLGTALGAQYEANEAKDPAKVLSGLQKKFGKLYRNPEFLNDMSNAAFKVMQRYGLNGTQSSDPKQFKPMINSVLKTELDQLEIKGMMPKGSAEYIMKTGLGNTIVGKITRKAVQTDYQNWLEDMANQQYQPGFWENVASGALTFAGDAWSYWLPGAAGGKLTKSMIAKAEGKLAGDLMAKGMERKVAERAAKVLIGKSKDVALKNGAVHGAVTFGGQSAISKPIDEVYRTGQFDENGKIYNPSVGKVIANTLGEVAKQSAVGAIMQGGTIANMIGKGRGLATNILADVGGKVVDSGIMTGQQLLERMAHDPNFKPTGKDAAESFLESMANLTAIGLPGMVGKYARFKDAREFNKKFDFTDQDIAELKRFGYEDLRDAFEKVGIGEYAVEGENAQRLDGQLTQKYMNLMNDKSVPEVLKAKMMAVVEGKRPSSFSPVIDSEVYRGDDGKYYLETYNKDGGVIDRKEYSSHDAARNDEKKMEYEKTLGLASVLEGEFHKEFTQEHLEGLYNKAAQKYNMGEKLTDEDKAAVYLHQNAGAIKEIIDKQQKGIILTDEEQKQVNSYRHYYDSALENSSVMREFVNTFEDSHGVARGTLRKALESKDKKYAPLVESYLKELYNSIELKREMKQTVDDLYNTAHGNEQKRIEQSGVEGENPAAPVGVDALVEGENPAAPVGGDALVEGAAGVVDLSPSEGPLIIQENTNTQSSQGGGDPATNVDDSSTKVSASDAYVMGQNAYQKGDAEGLKAIDHNDDVSKARLKRAFGGDEAQMNVVVKAYEDGKDMEQFVAQRANSLTPAQQDAVRKYVEAQDAKNGVYDALQHADDGYGEALKEQLWPYQTEDGNIVPATLTTGQQVFLKKANEYGGGFVVVPDEQGQPTIKQVSSADIKEVGTPVPMDDYINQQFAEQVDARYKQFRSQFDGSGLKPSDTVEVAMESGDEPMQMTFAGYSEDGKIVLSDGKDNIALSKDEFNAWRQNALDASIGAELDAEDAQRANDDAAKAEAEKKQRYNDGIVGLGMGQPDYSSKDTEPKVAAEYLQEQFGEDHGKLLNLVNGSRDDIKTQLANKKKAAAEYQNWLDTNADLDPEKAQKVENDQALVNEQIADLDARFKNWNTIRNSVMTPDEVKAMKEERKAEVEKAGVDETAIVPSDDFHVLVLDDKELKKQYPTMDEANDYITSQRKDIYHTQEDVEHKMNDVNDMLEQYINGETELDPTQLMELNTTKAQLEALQTNLSVAAKGLKAQANKLSKLYKTEVSQQEMKEPGMTPSEQRKALVADALKKNDLGAIKEIYKESSVDVTDLTPQTLEEAVSESLRPHSLNPESLQYELGKSNFKVGIGKGYDSNKFNYLIAKKGTGMSVNDFAVKVYNDLPVNLQDMGYTDQDVRNALLDMFKSYDSVKEMKNVALMNRIAAAEDELASEEEYYEAQKEREIIERQAENPDYYAYLEDNSVPLPTENELNQIAGMEYDRMMEIEDREREYKQYVKSILPELADYDDRNNEEGYGGGSSLGSDSSRRGVDEGNRNSQEGGSREASAEAEAGALHNSTGEGRQEISSLASGEGSADRTPHLPQEASFGERLKSAISETETEPTEAQKKAGNYKKGHLSFGGYDYTVETPKGVTRSGKDEQGKPWSVTMHDTYGYILGKIGVDGDHIDMFINDAADLDTFDGNVYVVDQVNPETGEFDEHKVMYGYPSEEAATEAYLANYSKDWKGLGKVTAVPKATFDKWLESSDRKTMPFADYAMVQKEQAKFDRDVKEVKPSEMTEAQKLAYNAVSTMLKKAGIPVKVVSNEDMEKVAEAQDNLNLAMLLNQPEMRFKIKTPEEKQAAENAYNFAKDLRPNKWAQYAVVDMSNPNKMPEYYQKQELARKERTYLNRLMWGNYKVFNLDKSFEDNVAGLTGSFPSEFDPYKIDAQTSKKNELKKQIKETEEAYKLTGQERKEYQNQLMKEYMDEHGLASENDIPDDVWREFDYKAVEKYQDKLDSLFAKYKDLDRQLKAVAEPGVQYLKGKGVVYGYTDGKEIVLNQEHLNANTPIHEYQHLWRTAAKKMNPKLIEHGDKLIMQTQLFADLKEDPNYKHLSDDEICDEAFARLTGEDGAAILEQMANDAIKENPLDTAKELTIINRLKNWLKKFWYWTLDTFTKWKPEDIKKMTLEDIRNLVLRDLANGVDPRNVKSRMTKEDAVSLRKQMEDNAEQERILEHTEENWLKEFGKDSRVTTPIGSIKLGENQYKKAGRNDRIKRFGLLKPTLERPDVILEKSAPKEGAERQTKYLFIKSFKKADGNKILNYESITVKQGEEEVAISAHQIEPSKVVKELTESKMLWNRFRGDSNSLGENQGSALTPSANNPSGKDSVLNPHSDAKIRNSFEITKGNDGNLSVEDEKTLAGVHNITEEKLRKALKLGGLANPSLAVIDTNKSAHDNFGEISFIAPSALVDKRTGKTAGTWITDAYTQRYPSVEREMSEKGSQKFRDWVDSLEYPSEAKAKIKSQAEDALSNNNAPAWELMYLKEKGIDIKEYDSRIDYRWKEIIKDHPTAEDILSSMQNDPELNEKVTGLAKHIIVDPIRGKISLEVRRKIYEETGVKMSSLNPQVRKQTKEIFERDYKPTLLDEDGNPKKEDIKKVVEDIVKEHNDTKKYDFYLSKVKASNYVNKNGLYDDYIRWQENKLDEFGTKNRIFRGYTKDGSRKYVPETLENVSKVMREDANGQTNGSEYTSFGSFIAKLASRVDSTDEMRANKDKLSSNEDKEEFYDKWSEVYYDLAKFLYNDVFYGEQRLHDIVSHADPKKYAKNEYGITLTPSFMKKLDSLKNAVQNDLKSAYFETKFNRPVHLNEFVAAVVPNNLGEDVRKGLEESGLSLFDYDPEKEGDRKRAFNEAINSNNEIRFHRVTEPEELERLNKEKTFRMYSGMQEVDGKLYSPMAAIIDGKRTDATEIGAWMGADERPDLVKGGKFQLVKTDKNPGAGEGPVRAAYNPYMHTSTSMMNDQFTGAYARGNIKVVEWEIPESEKTSGYHAEGAKDAVGLVPWHSGSVNGLLPKDRQRSVMLSRWRKAVRVVPDSEVAESIAKQLDGTGLAIPWNVVTPNQLRELVKLGVPITTEESGQQAPETKEKFLAQMEELKKEFPQAQFVNVKMTKDAFKEWGVKNNVKLSLGDTVPFVREQRSINNAFNDALDKQIAGTLPKGYNYQLGKPSSALKFAGIEDLPIELSSRTLEVKSSKDYKSNHPFDLNSVKNLPVAIQRPVAIFDSEYEDGRKVILTELKDGKGHSIIAVLGLRKLRGRNYAEVNSIISLYGKDSSVRIANWFDSKNPNGLGLDKNLCRWADTKKASEWLTNNASNVHSVGLSLKRIAKVINSFENNQFSEENLLLKHNFGDILGNSEGIAIENMRKVADSVVNTANKLGGAEATVYSSLDDVPEEYRSEVEQGAKGWYDPETHTVHVYLPNCADANEAERTVLHEKIGHEGMEVLLGGENEVRKFANFVYRSASKDVQGKIIDFANKYDPDWKNNDRMNVGTQEYIAHLAEEGPKTAEDFSLWTKIKHYLIKVLKKLGVRVPGLLNDKDLRYYLMKAGKALHVWDEMPREKQKAMMKQASNAEIKDALADGAGKGKPRQKKGESAIQYMKRVMEWKRWKEAREDKNDPEPPMFYDFDKDAEGKKEWERLNKEWRDSHHLQGDEMPIKPERKEGETDEAFFTRYKEWEKWNDAMADKENPMPDMFSFEKQKQDEARQKYEDWLTRHELNEQNDADLDLYEGKIYPAETNPEADALEQRVMQDLAEVTSTDVSKEGAAKTVKHAVIHRRKNMEEASADDAIYINDVKNRIEKMADSGAFDKLLSDYKGKPNRAEKLAEAIPYIIEAPRRLRDLAHDLNATGAFDKGHIHIQPTDVEAIQHFVADLIAETGKKHTVLKDDKEVEVYDDPQAVSDVASKMAQAINANHQGEEGFVPIDGSDIMSEHVLPLVKQQIVPEGIDYKNLSSEMKATIDSIRDWYNYTYDWLKDNRTLREDTGYSADYVNHIWDKEKSDKQAYAMYVENRQRTKSPNEKPRTISTLMEGISVGLVPKTTDITKMMAYYSRSNIEAWVNKTMLQELSGLNVIERNEDGEIISSDPLLSSTPPFNLEQYQYFEIPGVGPVWVYNVSPKQVKVKNPITGKERVLYSEASAGDRFGVVFETYQSSPFWKAFDTLASSAKKLELGFSGFHAGALTEVYMVQNMVEFGPKKAMANFMKYIFADTMKNHELPCFANPEDFQEAATHLVKFGATNDYAAADVQNMFDNMRDAMMKVQEKLKDGNGISGTVALATMPLKVATQMLSLINKGMDRALWDFLHDGLKLATYRMRADKTKERAKKKGWTEEELSRALDEDGQFVNDMFGGQHWDVLGASHRTLRYAGRVLLSPDWNASTTRHFLALTGFGSIWNEATFENFKHYYKRLGHGILTPEDEGRRSRQISALLCYGIGFMVFYEAIANGINAAFRAMDEEKERKKAEEIRKTNPSYRSPYELAYPDGMKWYDYLMRGNSLGQQSKIFMGRYADGTEMYIRHGKQFREVPEYLFNHKGELEFPGPMVQRMIGKANPMVRMTLDDINYLSDFQASHADEEIQRKYGKTIGLLYKDALYWAPFLIPSQENKEFKAVDFFFPSSKGFSPWKAQSYFKDFILSGDMEGVVMTYQSCQRNGIDPEAQIKAAIGSVKALESAEMQDGVTSLQEASKRFDAAKSITEKKKMRQKMKKFLSQSEYKAFTQKEALDMVQGYLNGDEDLKEMEKAESKYLMAAKAEDVTEDWRIQNVWNGTMETYQEYQRLKDVDKAKANAFKNSKTNKRLFAARKAISAAKKKMNKAKKQMDGQNDAAKLLEIRKTRKKLLETLNGME